MISYKSHVQLWLGLDCKKKVVIHRLCRAHIKLEIKLYFLIWIKILLHVFKSFHSFKDPFKSQLLYDTFPISLSGNSFFFLCVPYSTSLVWSQVMPCSTSVHAVHFLLITELILELYQSCEVKLLSSNEKHYRIFLHCAICIW